MDFDSVVIGAGVIGLAVARELAQSGRDVLLLERNAAFGQETSSRNSEVIHAGIYYPQGSLKAQLCVQGRHLLYQYCSDHPVDHHQVGKLIIASSEQQIAALNKLYATGLANGVSDLQLMGADDIAAMEPAITAYKAIYSPATGIIDSNGLMLSLLGDFEALGGTLCVNAPLQSARVEDDGLHIQVGGAEPTAITCRELINCAGLGAQEVSRSLRGIAAESIPTQYLSRGCYLSYQGKSPFSHLIYPMPNNEGLGVHVTLDLQGQARFGPDSEWIDRIDYSLNPNRADAFYSTIRDYFPKVDRSRLQPAYTGIRPKISGPGQTAGDFMIQGASEHGVDGYVALYGIESPGLTSCLAIALNVRAMLDSNSPD